MIVLSHPTGNSNVRALLSGMAKAGILAEFETTIAVNPSALWHRLLPGSVRKECLRRTYPVAPDKIRLHPYLELLRMISIRAGFDYVSKHESDWLSIDAVYQNLDKAVARRLPRLVEYKGEGVSGVYAYEDGALLTFKQAKRLGLKCFYDLPIAYWETSRELMREEAERLPNWAKTLGGGITDSKTKLDRKTQELELADIVIGPGQFVMSSLPAWASEKKRIVAPFGSPVFDKGNPPLVGSLRKDKCPLRVLFVGSMGQRKGLGDLFAAVRHLNRPDVQLIVMGTPLAPCKFYRDEFPDFIFEAGRPHQEVLALMRTCDVLCLPSIVEGRALVMQEAMSQGLPLIITPNTGGADLIIEGQTGFLVPIRSPSAIAEKINWFLENRSEIPHMGKLAQEHAAKYTWEVYSQQVINGLTEYN